MLGAGPAGGSGAACHPAIPSNGLRLSLHQGYEAGSSSSLPPVGLTAPAPAPPQPPATAPRPAKVGTAQHNFDLIIGWQEPERRHSLYDSGSRGRGGAGQPGGGTAGQQGGISAMNVNGLPEPFGPPLSRPPSTSHLHSSRTSLQVGLLYSWS